MGEIKSVWSQEGVNKVANYEGFSIDVDMAVKHNVTVGALFWILREIGQESMDLETKGLTDALHRICTFMTKVTIRNYIKKFTTPVSEGGFGLFHRINQTGYVYIVKSSELYKIGKSVVPKKRLRTYHTECPCVVELIACVKCEEYGKVEKEIHQKYAQHCTHGEWFDIAPPGIESIKSFLKEREVA